MSLRRIKGFTLVELMVTIAIVTILATIAFPSFQATLRSNRTAAAHNELLGLANSARSEAIRNNGGGGVCGSSTGTSCDGQWGAGILAFGDSNGNGTFDSAEAALRYVAVSSSMTVTGPSTLVAFDARGRRRDASDQSWVMQPVKCATSETLRRTITVNASGQVSSVKGACQ